MRSVRGVAAATVALATIPLAIITGNAFGNDAAETTIHFSVGIGFLLFAVAVFDFGLPRWVNLVGAAAGGAFGAIFLLQGISELVHIQGVTYLAFNVLGHEVERVLPDVFFVWFAALLLAGSAGLTRWVGWAIMPIVIGLEVAIVAGAAIGIDVPFVKLAFFLPMIWLLLESIKGRPTARVASSSRVASHSEAVPA
jgi:hypothetical protein